MSKRRLDTKITISREQEAVGAMHEVIISWVDIGEFNASYREMGGKETVVVDQLVAVTDAKFIIRYSSRLSDPTAKLRITYSGVVYEVYHVNPYPNSRPRYLEFKCRKRIDGPVAIRS